VTVESPIVEEVRRRRLELSGQWGHDLRRYGAHLRDVEAAHAPKVVSQITVVRSPDRPPPATGL